ncbi:MAG: hypothetical protein JSR69_16210 [Proteobacteria bacterium]|nr:hypothetical protein [Pseudomonadota bacterium]
MKLSNLPIGARFEFEGKIYTKTGPMTASAESGGQRMIPRYAVLKPVDGVPPPTAPAISRSVDADTVRSAFDAFYGTCLRLTDDFGRAELEAARQRFLESLEK